MKLPPKKKKKTQFTAEERLAHKTRKELTAEVKKVKAFEILKHLKKIRKLKDELSSQDADASLDEAKRQKAELRIGQLEEEMKNLKTMALEPFVDSRLAEIGLLQYSGDQKTSSIGSSDKEKGEERQGDSKDVAPKSGNYELFEAVLKKSPKLKAILEQCDQQATELRKCRLDGVDPIEKKKEDKRKLKTSQKFGNKGARTASRRAAPSSSFVDSLGGVKLDSESETEHSKSFGSGVLAVEARRNRPGQRERHRRGLVRDEAAQRKGGKSPFKGHRNEHDDLKSRKGPGSTSTSGQGLKRKNLDREQSPKPFKQESKRPRVESKPQPPSQVKAAQRKPKEAPAHLHPSWAAKSKLKEMEKSAVGAFSGKKITFADDD